MTIASEFKLRVPDPDSESSLLNSINRALLRYAARGEQVVVCLDEAQSMPVETLESLRLLSNMETEQRKLIQVVLVGQRELDAKLAHDNLRQLRSRITFSYRLGSLSLAETSAYLEHRAKVAGYRNGTLFTDRAVRKIYGAARGLPRRINILAHKALLAAYGQGADRVDLAHVNAARSDAVTPGIRAMLHDWMTRILSALHLRRINLPVRANQGISP
jgi:MSHA biogenesis protein MshM